MDSVFSEREAATAWRRRNGDAWFENLVEVANISILGEELDDFPVEGLVV